MVIEEKKRILVAVAMESGLIDTNVKDFAFVTQRMIEIYAKKNHDYGNSFDIGTDVIGLPYAVGHLYEKTNRIISLMKKGNKVDESMEDSLLDLANYSVMLLKYLRNKNKDEDNKDKDTNKME